MSVDQNERSGSVRFANRLPHTVLKLNNEVTQDGGLGPVEEAIQKVDCQQSLCKVLL